MSALKSESGGKRRVPGTEAIKRQKTSREKLHTGCLFYL